MGKDSFLIYSSFYAPVSKLSDKQLGRLFRAIFKYHIDGVVTIEEDIEMAFAFFKNQFEIDKSKYQSKVERNRENGRKGGMAKAKKEATCRRAGNAGEVSDRYHSLKTLSELSHNDNDNDQNHCHDFELKEILSDESTKKDGGDVAPPAPTPYLNFMQWMKECAPNVHAACGSHLTEAEFVKLRSETTREKLVDCVLALENRRDLLKKYRSLYLTLRNWLKRDETK